MSNKNEVYLVGTNAGEPQEIFFNKIEAFNSGYDFLDSFDEDGIFVKSYRFDGEEYIEN